MIGALRATCLNGEIALRIQVPVKTALRQPRSLHDVRHADALKAMLAKQHARGVHYFLTVGACLVPDLLSLLDFCLSSKIFELTLYMIIVMNKYI